MKVIRINNFTITKYCCSCKIRSLTAYYDQEVPRVVKWFLALAEPAILIVAGGVVAFILLAALLPIFSLYENIG